MKDGQQIRYSKNHSYYLDVGKSQSSYGVDYSQGCKSHTPQGVSSHHYEFRIPSV